ncbi:MAG: 2-amino-4-hydroxy-6-hydroxymethyldihydropteridine diphosphokinase [Gammaproteobacteria bacterium]|nr:2-amino-4-hydroxy-6-hydroxymethyldihydropteridine diphosphokinase [Gammaproteobacteria bacterium]
MTIRRGDPREPTGTQPEIFVGLGSNVQPEHYLGMAMTALEARFGALRRSTVYRNAAVGFDGDDFLNLVVGFTSSEDVLAISAALARIEQDCGRERSGIRFAPRTMDLDLLMYGQQVFDDPEFVLPRPEILQHAFILRPLAELAANVIHPLERRTLAQLWRDSDLRDHVMTPVDVGFQ